MRKLFLGSMMASAGAVILSLAPVFAADQAPAAKTEAYAPARMSDGQPDIRGFWRAVPGGSYSIEDLSLQAQGGQGFSDSAARRPGGSRIVDPADGRIPYLPWAAAKHKDIFDHHLNPKPDQLDPQSRCFLQGVPRATYQSEMQVVQTPGHLIFLIDFAHSYRVIPMDGRAHLPAGLKLFMGDSRGHWEGNTLVIDVTNNNDIPWFDVVGSFHSDALHVVERFTLVDAGTMDYVATLEDPKVYAKPWKMAFQLKRRNEPGYEQWEIACHEGENSVHRILR